MEKSHRKILEQIREHCELLGVELVGTATSREKLADRQKAHKLVALALYGVLADHPENEYSEEGLRDAVLALESLRGLVMKEYKDIHGNK